MRAAGGAGNRPVLTGLDVGQSGPTDAVGRLPWNRPRRIPPAVGKVMPTVMPTGVQNHAV